MLNHTPIGCGLEYNFLSSSGHCVRVQPYEVLTATGRQTVDTLPVSSLRFPLNSRKNPSSAHIKPLLTKHTHHITPTIHSFRPFMLDVLRGPVSSVADVVSYNKL